MKTLSIAIICTLSGFAQANLPAAGVTAQGVEVLLKQASFWQDRNRLDMARQALDRALQVDPSSEEVLYRQALLALNNDKAAYDGWLQRLQRLNPASPRIAALQNQVKTQALDRSVLPQIRQLAQAGKTDEAVTRYKTLLQGNPPPEDLALEYYQTLSGTQANWDEGRAGLEQQVRQKPGDVKARLALAEALTYRDDTRRQGIVQLAELAVATPEARKPWRQALLWLGAEPGDQALYARYAQAHPDDSDVVQHFQAALETQADNAKGQMRAAAFKDLNAGRLDTAARHFQQALQENPQDAEAWGGLGIIQLRAQDYTAAQRSLQRASELDPTQRARWAEALGTADFYGRLAAVRNLRDKGRLMEAEQQGRALTQASGEQGRAGKLLYGDILLRNSKAAEAEALYQSLLKARPNDTAAGLGLYNSYVMQQRTTEALALLKQNPALAKQAADSLEQVEAQALSERARKASVAGNNEQALKLYAQALAVAPNSPWIRLAYARLLHNSDPVQAQALMTPDTQRNDPEALHAAAVFAIEQARWEDAQRYIQRIPLPARTPEMMQLVSRTEINSRIAQVRRVVAAGNAIQARQALRELYDNAPADLAGRGAVAQALADMGQIAQALTLVQGFARDDGRQPVTHYVPVVSVLSQAGQAAEADLLLHQLERRGRLSAVDEASLVGLRRGLAVNQADWLRKRGDKAGAYDTLMAALAQSPRDPDLLLAMGRLYDSGHMPKEALAVYDYVLTQTPTNEDAVKGGVNAALALNDSARASAILKRSGRADDATSLYLSARIAQAEGRTGDALGLLQAAQRKQLSQGRSLVQSERSSPLDPSNPFRKEYSVSNVSVPLRVADAGADTAVPGYLRQQGEVALQPADPLLIDIQRTLADLQEQRVPVMSAGMNIRARGGDTGLSRLTEVNAPLAFSLVPFGNTRLDLTVTPVSISAGSIEGDTANRFGTSALYRQAAFSFEDKVTTRFLESVNYSTTTMTAADRLKAAQSVRDELLSADQNNALGAQGQAFLDKLVNNKASTLLAPYAPGSQSDSGVALNVALRNERFQGDIGSTPLGFEKQNIVGGFKWTPKIGEDGKLSLGVERRAVTDSVLSYAGTKDPLTGKSWGGVTKTGVTAEYAYDDGDTGAYVGGNYHLYRGDNVANNAALGLHAGAYVRPVREQDRELKTGIHLGWSSFDKNLSGYTLGHGGYFSPENYVGVSFPVEYTAKYGSKWNLKLNAAPGFQAFTQASEDYFPTEQGLQSAMAFLEQQGYVSASKYKGSSDSGLALSAGAKLEYSLGKQTKVGGAVSYDTFGDYSETTGQIYLKHNLENLP
ncbi:cellulose biosynthesis protein BcsC [Pseudomonas duriflava]|nr:cellulose biosynthesis protein BcsC [Pseudomonas duriflava]